MRGATGDNMSDLGAFKAYVKENPVQLDEVMREVYEGLTAGETGFQIFDGGSHKGWHAWRMIGLPGCSLVHAIEADPEISKVLSSNLGKWHQ